MYKKLLLFILAITPIRVLADVEPYFMTTVYDKGNNTVSAVFVGAVSEAVTTDCEDLMEVTSGDNTYYIYPTIEKAIKHSSIGQMLADNGYNISEEASEENSWDKIVQLIITPSCKLNMADVVVMNWLANVDKTGTALATQNYTRTGGKVMGLEIFDGVTSVVEDERICLESCYVPTQKDYTPEIYLRYGSFRNTDLEKVKLPSSITCIDDYAFSFTKLKSINLLDCKELTDLGHGCFSNCEYLETVYLPESLERIYGALFYADTAMKEIYVTSKNVLEEKSGNYDNFAGCQNGEIFIRLSLFNEYKNNGPENIWCFSDSFYPLIEKGKEWRTFSFDKDLDFSTIKGLYNEGNTLKAYYVSAFNPKDLSTTLTEGGALISNTGVLLYGEGGGAEGELYPIHGTDKAFDPNGTPPLIGNYLIAAVEGKNDIRQTENTYETNFLLHDGEFHLCDANGGSVDPYKAYLHIPVPLTAFTFTSSNSARLSLGTGNGNTSSINVIGTDTTEKTEAVYTLQGVRMPDNKSLSKGIYISNGKKFIVK